MAYQDTFYIYGAPVTCTEDGNHDWITADFKVIATANASNTAYMVDVYARIDSSGRMNWTGDGTLRVTYNGTTYSKAVKLEMYAPGTTGWDGPASFTLGAPGITNLTMNIDLDLTATTGTNGLPGPTHNSDGGNMQHFYYNNYSISVGDGGLPPLIVPPTISGLTNTNQYNSNSGISASTDSISIGWSESGTVANRYYRVNGGSWIAVSSSSASITGLSSGTSYTIEVKDSNSAGDSNILSATIRTRHADPIVGYSYDPVTSRSLESLIFSWFSDKPLSSFQYKVNNGSWVTSGSGTYGDITIGSLSPNTTYTVSFRGISTAEYDSLTSYEISDTYTTYDIARLSSIGDCIFGNSISMTISKPLVASTVKLKIWTTGNSNKPEFEMEILRSGTYTFTPTQDQLDAMYRCFTNSNSIPIYFSLTTSVASGSSWTDAQQNKTLQLTGIAKTAWVNVNNVPKRSQVWLDVNGTYRRAVVWLNVNNVPKRCI